VGEGYCDQVSLLDVYAAVGRSVGLISNGWSKCRGCGQLQAVSYP
jgi:hypothetical protein